MSLLDQNDPDEMGNHDCCLNGLRVDELERGQIDHNREDFETFWQRADELQDRSASPIENDTDNAEDAPPTVGVYVAAGVSGARTPKKRHVILLLPALLRKDGVLLAAPNMAVVLNEAHFEPQDTPRLPRLGSLSQLREVMARTSWPSGSSWKDAWAVTNDVFVRLAGSRQRLCDYRTDGANGKPLSFWLVPYDREDSSVRQLKALYAQLATAEPMPPLFASLCEGQQPKTLISVPGRLATEHTGHMSVEFGLDANQREALIHLLATPPGRLLAVSGPPGTGKTACLQAVIATTLVNATLEPGAPRMPLIIASAATNQAVTNIIKAFASIADEAPGATLGARWLSAVRSYGWFFPSRGAEDNVEFQGFQMLLRERDTNWKYAGAAKPLGELLKAEGALSSLSDEYLTAFRLNYPDHAGTHRVQDVCEVLLGELRSRASAREQVVPISSNLHAALNVVDRLTALVADAGLTARRRAQATLKRMANRDASIARRRNACDEQLRSLRERISRLSTAAVRAHGVSLVPVFSGWFGRLVQWLRGLVLGARRHTLVRELEPIVGISSLPQDPAAQLQLADGLLARWRSELDAAVRRSERLQRRVTRIGQLEGPRLPRVRALAAQGAEIEHHVDQLRGLAEAYLATKAAEDWSHGLASGLEGAGFARSIDTEHGFRFGEAVAGGGDKAARIARDILDQLLDRTIRRRCFDLAARYWEGRWLLETERAQHTKEDWEASLRRQCMLAPVVVGTVNTLPGVFGSPNAGFQLSVADLLIVDEAGQADPAMSLGLFALAKRAIVVGDVEQLKPIWKVRELQDRGFLRRGHLIEDADLLEERGLRASSGSAMVAAQSASAFSAEDGRGVTLTRHYRCRPTIIEFCNRLVYDRTRPLIPMTREDPKRVFPPMAYVDCLGRASRENGSVVNREEANELVSWLVDNRQVIEAFYNNRGDRMLRPSDDGYRDLGDLVAVVAPFAGQSEYLKSTLGKRLREQVGARADGIMGRIKLGTVHRLQGAERPLVLFSPTNTPNDGGTPFMDAATDMLNVAVSRAQDTFIVFGHPVLVFSAQVLRLGRPSSIMGRYMKRHGKRLYPRVLVAVESPSKAVPVQQILGRTCLVIATEGHFREIDGNVELSTGNVRWRVDAAKQSIITRIAEQLAEMDELVIATDDDREGDAIGWHLVDELRGRCPMDGLVITRMVFQAMSETAVRSGFEARVLWTNGSRAHAAVTRAIVDAAIGQVMTGLVGERMRGRRGEWRIGVGRVRAALLQLVADLEARQETTGDRWCVKVNVEGDGHHADGHHAALWVTSSSTIDSPIERFRDRQGAQRAADAVRDSTLRPRLARRPFTLGPAPAVGTAEVLIAAYERLGLQPADTMKLLQDLYEGNRRAVDAVGSARTKLDLDPAHLEGARRNLLKTPGVLGVAKPNREPRETISGEAKYTSTT